MAAPDRFTGIVPTRRGSGRHDDAPRFLPPPESSAEPLKSLPDFKRRLRPGVVVVFDDLDQFGQVTSRIRGVVGHKGKSEARGFRVRSDDGLDFASYPTRRSDCELDGPTITYRPRGRPEWRLTFLDESDAALVAKRVQLPPASEANIEHITARLGALMGRPGDGPRWLRWPDSVGLICGWTTEPEENGQHLSFAAVPVNAPGALPSSEATDYELVEESVACGELAEAKGRARRMWEQHQAGKRRPWL